MMPTSLIWLMWSCLFVFALINHPTKTVFAEDSEDGEEMLPRIGIIGSGISGASSAYFLRQLFGKKAVIDIFEAEKIGGRMALVDINGQKYEAGASIIHGKNRYMVNFADTLNGGFPKRQHSAGLLGFYDKEGIRFQTSKWTPVTVAKLAWRYGMDLYTIQQFTSKLLQDNFNKIYDFQDKGMAFTTVEDMLLAMGESMVNMTKYSMKQVLLDAGLSERFVDELGMGAARNNYGQTTDVHGFVGAVTMCAIESGLWSVQGGNYLIPVHLIKESAASVVKASVSTIALIKGDTVSYEVEYEQIGKDGVKTNSREYDIVIVAAPLEGSKMKISFVDFPVNVVPFSQPYHRTVALFVEGKVNTKTFKIDTVEDFPPDLFTIDADLFFNSVGKQSPVDSSDEPDTPMAADHSVWKTFLNTVPNDNQISQLFEQQKNVKLVNWEAYPEYTPGMDLPSFLLYDRLYYVNAIESAAAAMEMNAIGAKNVALLAFNHWNSIFDKIDEHSLLSSESQKSEL